MKKEYKSRFHIDSDNVTMHFIAVETSGNIGRGTIELARFIANNQDPADEIDVIADYNTLIPFQRTLRRIYKRINVSVLSFRSWSAQRLFNRFALDNAPPFPIEAGHIPNTPPLPAFTRTHPTNRYRSKAIRNLCTICIPSIT